MDIKIDRESEATIREQLREQIVFLIATGNLKPGGALPSVRSLARKLKIHPNTVSQAYQDLVGDWLVRRHGAPMVVRPTEETTAPSDSDDLDELINRTIQAARKRGYSLRQLQQRFQERLTRQRPDHLLVVGRETSLRLLLREELKESLPFKVESCSAVELGSHPELTVGALIVMTPGIVQDVVSLIPNNQAAITLTFSAAEEHLEMIRQLNEPSMIAVVSVSSRFLAAARGLLSPLLGEDHTLSEFLLPSSIASNFDSFDLVFCDSIARRQLRGRSAVPYRAVSPASLSEISTVMEEKQNSD